MASETPMAGADPTAAVTDAVEMPRPTAAPLVVSLGIALAAAGLVTGPAFLCAGGVVLAIGLGIWIADLASGRGHVHEPVASPAHRPRPIRAEPGTVRRLEKGMPGYRIRLPSEVHPISAGLKGGILGGIVMVIPALLYGVLSGHGPWYPVNLLAGMWLPGVDQLSTAELEKFRPSLFLVAAVVHAVNSVIFGLIYGVLLPTLPRIPTPLAWGGLLMPLLWSGASYGLLRVVNPVLNAGVDWPWFVFSQFCYGVAAALVVMAVLGRRPVVAGLLGGIVGGLLMPIPALLWGLATGRGVWYPINLLAAMIVPAVGKAPAESLGRFHPEWLLAAVVVHATFSLAFGLLLGRLAARLPPISAALAWGGMLIPLLFTAVSYGLMGVVNPLLQHRVDWPWFIVSQFIFGIVAAVVVDRSERVYIPPAGTGPEPLSTYLEGTGEGTT